MESFLWCLCCHRHHLSSWSTTLMLINVKKKDLSTCEINTSQHQKFFVWFLFSCWYVSQNSLIKIIFVLDPWSNLYIFYNPGSTDSTKHPSVVADVTGTTTAAAAETANSTQTPNLNSTATPVLTDYHYHSTCIKSECCTPAAAAASRCVANPTEQFLIKSTTDGDAGGTNLPTATSSITWVWIVAVFHTLFASPTKLSCISNSGKCSVCQSTSKWFP